MTKYETILKRNIGTKIVLINAKSNRTVCLDKTGGQFWDSFLKCGYDFQKTIKYLQSKYNPKYSDRIQKDFPVFLDKITSSLGCKSLKGESSQQGATMGKEKMLDFVSNERILESVYFEVTQKCPYNCVHCFCLQDGRQELTTEEIKNILDQLFELGTVFLTITGGDPLIREDFNEIYLYAKKKGFLINLFTNAFLIDNEKIKLFKEYLPYNIDITLYGASKEVYEKFVRRKDSFEVFCENIEELKKSHIPFRLKSLVSKINIKEIRELVKFAKRYCDSYYYKEYITPKLNGDKTPLKWRCTPKEIVDIEDNDKQVKEEWMRIINETSNNDFIGKGLKCTQGFRDIAIDAYGKAFFCSVLRYKGINLKENSVKDAWNYLIRQRDFFDEIVKKSECANCGFRYICNWCPADSLLENGTLNEKVDFLCELSKERVERYKIHPIASLRTHP